MLETLEEFSKCSSLSFSFPPHKSNCCAHRIATSVKKVPSFFGLEVSNSPRFSEANFS
ncbi:hypothetical protein LguiB_030968 [Lonicera macranthoides]